MRRFVAVVGGKHSGKTTVIQNLVLQLKNRGFRVGTRALECASAISFKRISKPVAFVSSPVESLSLLLGSRL